MASTSPPPHTPPGSSPSLSDARSALAISHAKPARGRGARIGGIVAALVVLAGTAFTMWFLRQPRAPAEPAREATKTATPEPELASTASTFATAATPQRKTSIPPEAPTGEAVPTVTESAGAQPTTPPLATTAHPIARPRPTSRPAPAASSVAPATSQSEPPPAQPSEAEMLNRRR
jgi:cytoskeletal protein RodZ